MELGISSCNWARSVFINCMALRRVRGPRVQPEPTLRNRRGRGVCVSAPSATQNYRQIDRLAGRAANLIDAAVHRRLTEQGCEPNDRDLCHQKKKQSMHVGRNVLKGPLRWRDKAAGKSWCSGVATFSPLPQVIRPALPLPSSRKQRWAHSDRPVPRGPVLSRAGCIVASSPDGVAIQTMQGLSIDEWNCEGPICNFEDVSRLRLFVWMQRRGELQVLLQPLHFTCCELSTAAKPVSTDPPPKSPEPDQE